MLILASSVEYILIPVDGPAGLDLTQFSIGIALMPDNGTEPDTGDYQPATWVDGEPAVLSNPDVWSPGEYMAFVRVSAPPEDVRRPAGRVRIGDTRT